MMSLCLTVQAADMADVRRLAREPVETIFSGAPIGRVSDATYWKTVQGSPKPVVVVFYANQDQQSRHLATLVRYLALEFSEAVVFYGYPVTAGSDRRAQRARGASEAVRGQEGPGHALL
jgi:hypothetical protein